MLKEVVVPDIGNVQSVDVIEINVALGQQIQAEEPLITVESDKATMEIPAPFAGSIKELKVKVGDKVSQGQVILIVETAATATETAQPIAAATTPVATAETPAAATQSPLATTSSVAQLPAASTVVATNTTIGVSSTSIEVHAGPAVRRLAREFGVDLSRVQATGEKGRVLKEDVQRYVKAELQRSQFGGQTSGLTLPPPPAVDFSRFGEVETKALTRIKKLTAVNLHRNWLTVPHVTQFDEADITELEAFRLAQKAKFDKQNIKLTPLVFIMKAAVAALKAFPTFNASLDPSGEHLIIKKYFHIGVAVDTPEGLVVPVIRDVDKKSLTELAQELAQVSEKARSKALVPNDMQGSCFTISSLGGIGGTAFTPIVNLPDVAILGVSKAKMQPVYQNGQFVPRLMLPLSLSYDHRVIDGAEGARFASYLATMLTDVRQLLL